MTESRPFEPIAVIAMSCRLPGCDSPEALWQNVLAGRDLVAEGLTSLGELPAPIDPAGFCMPPAAWMSHDPVFRWALEGGHEALRRARLLPDSAHREGTRGGLVMGNLMLPTRELVALSGQVWLGRDRGRAAHPASRFSAGLPALTLARALGLEAGGLALDAACASSLYALKLACDKLHDGEADWMLVGAISHADDLILEQALGSVDVLSPTHQSRPFHHEADGMVRSEGAAFVVVRPLSAALAAGDSILAVLRGLGIGNSGRTRGLLAPSERGQVEAMQAAYQGSGLTPADISLLECHATGNLLADLIEVRSLRRVFPAGANLPLGSLRSNIGHPITASGLASLIKVIFSLQTGIRAATLHAEKPLREVARSGFRLLAQAEAWETTGPRRAAINSFGFGGNNAHLLVEQWLEVGRPPEAFKVRRPAGGTLAVVGMGVQAADGKNTAEFIAALDLGKVGCETHQAARQIALPVEGLGIAVAEVAEALPQQLMMLSASLEAFSGVYRDEGLAIATMIGLACDPNGSRSAFRDDIDGARTAAAFTGRLTNLVANRLNFHLDLHGPGWALASEEASGIDALKLAARALRAGEVDAVLVGAVDLSAEPVHAYAAQALADETPGFTGDAPQGSSRMLCVPGDAAIALVIKRLDDALRVGDRILALLPDAAPLGLPAWRVQGVSEIFGHAHAASGLLDVAAAIACCQWQRTPSWLGGTRVLGADEWLAVDVTDMLGGRHEIAIAPPPQQTPAAAPWMAEADWLTIAAHEPEI
jgi:acyl transferase domain-containing protein